MDRPSVSVCMATYNGAKYVRSQLESILAELEPGDEVVVVDDDSTDDTVHVIEAIGDRRIHCHLNQCNRREVYSFGRAMSLARHEIILLSDQDDVWLPGRVALMVAALTESRASLVSSNFESMDGAGEPLTVDIDGVSASDSRRHSKNIWDIFRGRTNYYGCAMAFRRDLNRLVLPIPRFVESHDLWIALAANLARTNVHLDAKTLRKRQHGANVTGPVSWRRLSQKLWSRCVFAFSLAVLAGRRLARG